jgi:hypothetical protein
VYHPQNLSNVREGMVIRRLRFMYQIHWVMCHISNLCGTSETGLPFHTEEHLAPFTVFFQRNFISFLGSPALCCSYTHTRTPARTTGTLTVPTHPKYAQQCSPDVEQNAFEYKNFWKNCLFCDSHGCVDWDAGFLQFLRLIDW